MKLVERKKIRFYLQDIGFKEISYFDSKVDTYKYVFDDGEYIIVDYKYRNPYATINYYNVEGDRKNKEAVKFYTFDELKEYLES